MMLKYKHVTVHNHPFFPGKRQVQRSRLVMAEYLGRPLLRTEDVHHKNENTLDDRRENLKLMMHGKHTIHHWTGKHHTAETKSKISLNNVGMSGKRHTIEVKQKMSLARKDYWMQQRFPGV